MKLCLVSIAGLALLANGHAQVLLFDNFDNSFPGEPALLSSIWPTWPTATDHLSLWNNHNHTPGGTNSVRLAPEDPYTLANYNDFGATAEALSATVWVWDDNSSGTGVGVEPVNFFFGFYGDSPTWPTNNSDYLLLGLSPTFPDNNTYGYKTLSGGATSTGVTRAAAIAGSVDHSGWLKLSIQADALAAGGQVRFYINDVRVGASTRQPGVSLRYLFMGSQSSNYEFFWFDDVTIALLPTISNIFVNGNRVTINFTAGAGDPPSAFTLLSSDTVDGVYAPATGALIAGGAGSYEAAVPTNGPAQFYRLRR